MSPQEIGSTESNGNATDRPGSLAPPTSRPPPIFETIDSAAPKLGVEPGALRSRCQRAARRAGTAAVAQLGGGIVAFKFGKTWRIRFPAEGKP
jgi:hypothetical protein